MTEWAVLLVCVAAAMDESAQWDYFDGDISKC